MGVCYSQEQQWHTYSKRNLKRRKRTNKQNSIIYEQRTMYQDSFNSGAAASFREDAPLLNSLFVYGNVEIGSVVELSDKDQEILENSLSNINTDGQIHSQNQVFTLCNLKNRFFLHTHRVKLANQSKQHQVSCCPFNSTHMVEYDLWKLVKSDNENRYFIYHPFTQRFLNIKKGEIVCSQEKLEWQVDSFGNRRNGGYLKIKCNEGQLCMTSQKGLLQGHRKIIICKQRHISHLWQLRCGDTIDLENQA